MRGQHWHLPEDYAYVTITLSTQHLSLGRRCFAPIVLSPALYWCVRPREARDKAYTPVSQDANGKKAPCLSQPSTYLRILLNSRYFTCRAGPLAQRCSLRIYPYQWELVLISVCPHSPGSCNLLTHDTSHLLPTCEGFSDFRQCDIEKERQGDESCFRWAPGLRTDCQEGRCTLLFPVLSAVSLSACQVFTTIENCRGSGSPRLDNSKKGLHPNV